MMPEECSPNAQRLTRTELVDSLETLLMRAQFELAMWHIIFTDTADLLIERLKQAKERQ